MNLDRQQRRKIESNNNKHAANEVKPSSCDAACHHGGERAAGMCRQSTGTANTPMSSMTRIWEQQGATHHGLLLGRDCEVRIVRFAVVVSLGVRS